MMMVEIDFGKLYDRIDYEWKYIRITSVPTHYWEDKKYRRVRDVEARDIGDERFKEIHFTVVRKNRSYRMVVVGKLVEMMSRDL